MMNHVSDLDEAVEVLRRRARSDLVTATAFSLMLAKLETHGVRIELAEAEGARYFSRGKGFWVDLNGDFDDSKRRVVLAAKRNLRSTGGIRGRTEPATR